MVEIGIQQLSVWVRQPKETSQIGSYKAKSARNDKWQGNPVPRSVLKAKNLKFLHLMMKIPLDIVEIEIQQLSVRVRQPKETS